MDTRSPRAAGAPRAEQPRVLGETRAEPAGLLPGRGAGRRRLVSRLAALSLALLAVPGAAVAAVAVKGKVVGTVKLLNPVWNEAKDPKANRYTFREPSPTVRSDVRTLVGYTPKELCIAALGDKGAPARAALKVTVAGGRTSPVTLVVAEGQQIQFENQDPFPHKLYDVGNKGFQAVELGAAKTRSWTPPGPGKYEIRDQLAPSIRSWIVVEPRTSGVGYPDRQGNFVIDLEPGRYSLQGYFNGAAVGSPLQVNVKPGAEQVVSQPLTVGEVAGAGAGK
jgi:hypothetical protein